MNGAYISHANYIERANLKVNTVHMKKKKDLYHHGDLRTALVGVAVERVRRSGAESFSLREAARDVGVTSGAAYNHFADKEQLLAAVAAEARKLLAKRTLKTTSGLNGVKRLEAVGRAYIEFASAEPFLFRLAFSRLGAASGPPFPAETNGQAVPTSYEQLRMAVKEVQPDGKKPVDEDVLALAWSVAHGAASLISDGMWKKNDPRAEAALRLSIELIATRR
jgi:AcrR family transcriptional regulator